MSDNLHPNDTGYALLGQTWYGAISGVLPAP
jgi:lysophospholipase L1-like esterase